jgi:hypothetical protein
LIPAFDPPCPPQRFNLVAGEQTPDDCLLPLRGIDLVNFDQRQRDRWGIGPIGALARPGNAHPAGLHSEGGEALHLARPMRWNANVHAAELAPVGRGGEQALVIVGELAAPRWTSPGCG